MYVNIHYMCMAELFSKLYFTFLNFSSSDCKTVRNSTLAATNMKNKLLYQNSKPLIIWIEIAGYRL